MLRPYSVTGLWNYCTTSSLDDGVNCAPLVNGTDNQLLLFSGKAKPAQESNVQVDGCTTHCGGGGSS